jgi:hypothetical protein
MPTFDREARTSFLLDALCAEFGFCLPPSEQDKLIATPPETADAFTDAVFAAEGFDPGSADRRLWTLMRERVHRSIYK